MYNMKNLEFEQLVTKIGMGNCSSIFLPFPMIPFTGPFILPFPPGCDGV